MILVITLSTVDNVKCFIGGEILEAANEYIQFISKEFMSKKLNISAILEGMSPMEYGLACSFLKYEKDEGEHVTVSVLAKEMEISVSQVSRMLKNMEERGLISRVTDEACRRNTFVVISDKGRELHEKNRKNFSYFAKKVLEKFSQDEIQHMMNMQKRFFDAVQTEISKIKNEKTLQEV